MRRRERAKCPTRTGHNRPLVTPLQNPRPGRTYLTVQRVLSVMTFGLSTTRLLWGLIPIAVTYLLLTNIYHAHCPLIYFKNATRTNIQAAGNIGPSRIIVHNRWSDKPGGAEALLQLTLAFHSWLPNQTYAQGRTSPSKIEQHWLDWYPAMTSLNILNETSNSNGVANQNVLRRGDIYIIPELFSCPSNLINMGVRVFIYKLGAVGSHGSLLGQRRNIQLGCKYLSHSYWLLHAEELEIPEDRLFLPYITPEKSHKGEVSNAKRENLIIVNGHDPSSQEGDDVQNYCKGKDCDIIVLKGFNTAQLIDLYQKAKSVVAFCMRGCERSPIEAVLAGAVLVSNWCLAAQNRLDFPIPEENIVSANNTARKVLGRILANFEEEQKKMSDMRTLYQQIGPETLVQQTHRFILDVQNTPP